MNLSLKSLLLEGAAKLGVSLDEEAILRFSTYLDLLQLWGRKINLTSRRDSDEIVVYHFLDSLAGAPLLEPTPTSRVVDIGAGSGLPSLPVKFALPGLRVSLVESVRKKVSFCREVVRATGISGVEALWGRGELFGISAEHRGTYDWAVSRAVGQSADVGRIAIPFLLPGGRILLYKGDPAAGELLALETFCREHGADFVLHRVTVPYLKGVRSLIVIRRSAP